VVDTNGGEPRRSPDVRRKGHGGVWAIFGIVAIAVVAILVAVGYSYVQGSTSSGQAGNVVANQAHVVSTAIENSLHYDSAKALAWEAAGASRNDGPVGEQVLVARGSVRRGGATLVIRFTATVQGDEFQGTATVTRCYEYHAELSTWPTPEEVACPNNSPITFTTAPTTSKPE
jgi:hypothetical protein